MTALAILVGACGGGGGGGDGGSACTPSATVQLSYADYRVPASQSSFASGNEWFASLERVGFNPRFSEICGAGTAFRVISGRLPAGVTLDSTTGVISGSPTETGSFNPTIGMRASGFGGEATRTLNFVVDDFGIFYPSTGTGDARVGTPIAALSPTLTDALQSDSTAMRDVSNVRRGSLLPAGTTTAYAVTSGALPPGVTLDPGTGRVSGTPALAGSYSATVELLATKDGFTQSSAQDGSLNFFVSN
ncbi:putative Ig domain-containing protein [Caenimonas sedimenti]|uniref:putative Ig domain-containing protein n=1 Tax=Caenimonas sedimenti TaxID=2596921 RepID=UPI0016455EA8|nr:putative Ig domain-containing protein [Caenimonas sedimenti]